MIKMKIRDLHLTIKHAKTKGLHKVFYMKKKKILDGINFDINSKTAIVGPNGSGKTMTLSVIAQLIKPQKGSFMYQGEDILKNELFKDKLGVMIQEGNLDPDEKVLQEMELIKNLRGDKTDLRKLLNKYDIDPDTFIRNLPHGKYKILLVLQAMLGNPELLILDEPFSGLDIINRKVIEKILKEFKGKMLITTHLLNEIKNVCTDIVFIKEGKVIQKKKIKQIKNLDNHYIKLYS